MLRSVGFRVERFCGLASNDLSLIHDIIFLTPFPPYSPPPPPKKKKKKTPDIPLSPVEDIPIAVQACACCGGTVGLSQNERTVICTVWGVGFRVRV